MQTTGMELSRQYQPADVEDKWYTHWLSKGYFHSEPDARPSYTIVIPPPNVTGVLHMGHMLNNTIQDILIRRARQQGYNACWVPGTDHASIATEARVVRMLREKGIKKSDIGRKEFLRHAHAWKEQYGGIILEQLKKLGASCDWERTAFTMDEAYHKAVIRVFVDLYRKGYIYRSLRMINWDCEAKTALSNEEVIYKEPGEQSNLYHIRYRIADTGDDWITIATTRPETILADTAIAVNPDDERYARLKGKFAIVPFINRRIPIIMDDYVEKDFGTGCLKVTPAHDQNDYDLGQRHSLPVIDIIDDDGSINAACEVPEYVGLDRFALRKRIVKELEEAGHLLKTEAILNKVGRSERTNTIVEPKLSLQWFINMQDISKTALEVVENDEVQLLPAKFKNTYRHWMENVKDWCISRQLWWGQRIPAWFLPDGSFLVAENEEEALALAQQQDSSLSLSDLNQDEDVLDTWASSWLWPMAVFNGFNDTCFDKESGKIDLSKNKELAYYYPTQVLVTAPEILFFWVARMIIAGMEYTGKPPFHSVYLTGIVRDKQGRKMSKSLGNSPDPLDLIAQYGADGVRFGMLATSPAGNDLLYDEKLVEQGRNFCNKLWNALRLVKGWEVQPGEHAELQPVFRWLEARMQQTITQMNALMAEYRLSDALMTLYNFIWDDFCSWYLEWVKPPYGEAIHQGTLERTITFFEQLTVLLHPFMPFITEEIYHSLKERPVGDDICLADFPSTGEPDLAALQSGEKARELISAVRDVRNKAQLPQKQALDAYIVSADMHVYAGFLPIIMHSAFLAKLDQVNGDVEDAVSMLVGRDKLFVVTGRKLDAAAEKVRIQGEIDYYTGFIAAVQQKLSNERFVQNAKPDIVEKERQKLADGQDKLRSLQASLAQLG
jgi:valyl-tRNA synthetase